ncbi:helix-turn-helix domain-containing protein [Paenibacillus koleovorans]|uniref:helix-turn-helix domain-containing protein n=1 Tax=Paenibacillus koleovorans TaxID=121608 RepID=UPI000FDB1F55|nr:AraC family transcriptional regulator [Paenibacillus koleovorans]
MIMQGILKLRRSFQSFFVRMLANFLFIIFLLVSFNSYSFSFFTSHVTEEIIRYNNVNLQKTMDDLENQFKQIRTEFISIFNSNQLLGLNAGLGNTGQIDYYFADKVKLEISDRILSKPALLLSNIIFYYRDAHFFIDKNTVSSLDFFQRYYFFSDYSTSYWSKLAQAGESFTVLPSTKLLENYAGPPNLSVIPIVVRNLLYPKMYAIALLDADKIFRAYHKSINDNFFIRNAQGSLIFFSSESDTDQVTKELPVLTGESGHVQWRNHYYFYTTGPYSGFTYVNAIPIGEMTQEVSQMKLILISLLLVAVGVSVAASIYFTLRLHNPLKQIVESVHQLQSPSALPDNIKEFAAIQHRLDHLFTSLTETKHDLDNKSSLLRTYSYIDSLRNIQGNHLAVETYLKHRPFAVFLVTVAFKPSYYEQFTQREQEAVAFMLAFIDKYLLGHYPDPVTFQIEKNQILSIVPDLESHAGLEPHLQHLKQVFDMDMEFCVITITVSSVYRNASHLTQAYEQALHLIERRKIGEGSQIIYEEELGELPVFLITLQEEQEFNTHLQAGNAKETIHWVLVQLDRLDRKAAFASHYSKFATHIADKVEKLLHVMNLPGEETAKIREELSFCDSLERYKEVLTKLLACVTDQIRRKLEEQDAITTYVFNYIDAHYHEPISLDLLADRLRISSGYLSTYFKEKTGNNFIDYLHQVRLNRAMELLDGTDLRIQEIAERVGYANVNSFIRMFKKLHGVTPGDYRKKMG